MDKKEPKSFIRKIKKVKKKDLEKNVSKSVVIIKGQ